MLKNSQSGTSLGGTRESCEEEKTNSFSFSPLPSGMAEPGFNYPHNSTMTCFCIDSAPAERRGHRTNGAVWSERHQKDQPGGWGPDRGDQERECQCGVSGEQRGDATNRQPRLHMRVLMRHFMPFRDCKPCDVTRSLSHPSRHDHIFVESGNVSIPKNIYISYWPSARAVLGEYRPEVLAVRTEPLRRGPYKKDRGPIFSQYGPSELGQ